MPIHWIFGSILMQSDLVFCSYYTFYPRLGILSVCHWIHVDHEFGFHNLGMAMWICFPNKCGLLLSCWCFCCWYILVLAMVFSFDLWRVDWSSCADSYASACLITSSSWIRWLAFARMSVWRVSSYKPQISWSLMWKDCKSLLHPGQVNSRSGEADFNLMTKSLTGSPSD